MNTTWMQDPAIAHIDKAKLEFLQALVFESQALSKEQMLPFLMAVAKKGKDKNISFDETEIDCIVETIRRYAPPEDCEKINKITKLFKNRKH